MRSKRIELIALFGVLLLLGAIATVIQKPPAEQYEISLYGTYSSLFWALVTGALLTGSLVIIECAVARRDSTWIYGTLIILLTTALLVVMPLARGYEMYGRSDQLTHIGFARDLASSGVIGGNLYPPTHLLSLVLSDLAGVELMGLTMVLPVMFSTIYFGAMFYLVTLLFDSREQILFGLPFVMLPVLGVAHLSFRPFDLSVMLVPFVFYLFIKSQRSRSPSVRAIFVIALITTLLYHPLTALFLSMIFSLYYVAQHTPTIKKQSVTPTNLFSLSAVVFLGWYTKYAGVVRRFNSIYLTLFGSNQGSPPIQKYSETVNTASPELIDLIRVAAFTYGTELVTFGLGYAFLALALIFYLRKQYALDTYTVMFAGALVAFNIGGLMFLFSDLIVPPDRPFQFAKLGAIVLAGQLFYFVWRHVNWERRWSGLRSLFLTSFILTILVLIVLVTFSIYPSPLVSKGNNQVTEMEVEGVEWMTTNANATDEFSEFGIRYYRFHDAQYGKDTPHPFTNSKAKRPPPPHFNYTNYRTLGQSYESDRYMILTRNGRLSYPERFPRYPEQWRYSPSDFAQVERDRTVNRVYDNGDFDLYLIEGRRDAGPDTT